MVTNTKHYPIEYSSKELIEKIHEDSVDISYEQNVLTSEIADRNRLFKLGRIQLGLAELQNRQAKRITRFTIAIAVLSFFISLSALMFTIFNNRSMQKLEKSKYEVNKEILQEIRSMKD